MNDLRFYDLDFNLLHIEHDFSAVCWYIKYNSVGTFESEFASTGPFVAMCSQHKYMIVCQGALQAIITYKRLEGTKLIMYGRTINFLLKKRCVPPFSTDTLNITNGSCGIAQYVISNYCNDFVTIGKSVNSKVTDTFSRSSMNTAKDVICDCLDRDNLGHRLVFNPEKKQWIFDVIKGTEKNLVFSDDTFTSYAGDYSQNILDFATSGYYKQSYSYEGQWNPTNNTPILTNKKADNYAKAYKVSSDGNCFGIDFIKDEYIVCKTKDGTWSKCDTANSFWEYISCDKKGVYRWDTILSAETESEAVTLLNEINNTDRITSKLRNLEYGKDFDLGDVVTVSIKFGNKHISLKQRVNAVTIWYEKGYNKVVKPEFKNI